MYKRMLLLSLGWKTHNPYEQGMQQALHAFHATLVGSVFLVLALSYVVGFMVTGSMETALYFLLLPMLADIWRVIELVLEAMLLVVIFFVAFEFFFLVMQGNVSQALFVTISAISASFLLSMLARRKRSTEQSFFGDNAHLFSESPTLTSHIKKISRLRNIPPMTVYICRVSSWNAQAHTYGSIRCISVNAALHENISTHAMLGVLGHELGHFVIPLGRSVFYFFQSNVFVLGNVLTKFFERKALKKMNDICMPKNMAMLSYVDWKLVQYKWLMSIATICSLFSSYPTSRRREYVADACSAYILQDAIPLIGALTLLTRGTQSFMLSDSHPLDGKRIEHLNKIEADANHTRP